LARADVVTEWNTVMRTVAAGQNPFAQARTAAIVHLAVFEAVNAITGGYRSYLSPPIAATQPASAEAAAVAAAHRALTVLLPASAAVLDDARAASLARIADGAAKGNGLAVGEAAADAMLALRANDGATPPAFHLPSSADPGEWQLTAGCPPAGGILAHWGRVAPFGVADVERFRSAPPPPLTSRRYARDLDEVKATGQKVSALRSAAQADVARFYAAVLAVATWNPVAAQVSAAQQRTMSFNARLFALLNIAIGDALVAVMESKYVHRFWRPETAIRHADLDGNDRTEPDSAWEPFIVAPCFPSYGSAHAAASYAARAVLERLLGDDEIDVTLSHAGVPGVVLDYDSFETITEDIDDARVYGGIHFRFDQRAGARQGKRIAEWIVRHALQPRR
jgi:hypothetical protein